jgi:hypothetical protein
VSYYFDEATRSSMDDALTDVRHGRDEEWRVPRQVAADAAYRGHASVSYAAMARCDVVDGGWGGAGCGDRDDFDLGKTLPLAALGYIGEEVEGELPEAYYDVHASVELMWIMTVIRALPAVTTYFCDTFLWYTFFATMFTVFLQWRGKITHAQNWAFLLRTFATVPGLFCEKLLNRDWPRPEIVRGGGGDAGGSSSSGSEGAHGAGGSHDPLAGTRLLDLSDHRGRERSGGVFGDNASEFVLELPHELADAEGAAMAASADPVDFLPEATDVKQQHFARAWNAIVADLRRRDHLSDAERDDLSYTFLSGRDAEQVFDAAEYVVLPAMITSPVFSTTSLEAGKGSQYASFARTLIQTKDLLCALFTEVLGVVSPRDAHTLMRIAVDLSRVEAEHMARRRMDDTEGYVALRDALAELLMALQALAAQTTAVPAAEPEERDDDGPGGRTRTRRRLGRRRRRARPRRRRFDRGGARGSSPASAASRAPAPEAPHQGCRGGARVQAGRGHQPGDEVRVRRVPQQGHQEGDQETRRADARVLRGGRGLGGRRLAAT